MEFNLSLSTSMTDFITYFNGSSNNITSELKEGLFDDVLDKSFCDEEESEDIDYNLILNLLNNIDLPNINNINKSYDLETIYTNKNAVSIYIDKNNNNYSFDIEESKNSSNVEVDANKLEQNFESSKYVKIFNVLEKVNSTSGILNNSIDKVKLSNEEIELLKKLDNIVSGNKENDESFVIKKINNMNERVKENVVYEKINENDPDIEKNNNYNFNVEKSETNSKIDVNINKVEQNFESSKYVEIFNVLEKVQAIPEILDGSIEQVKLSSEEIELLKKLDNIVLGNKENDESFVIKKIDNMSERVKENVVYEKINENDPDIEKNNYNFNVEESKTNSKMDVNVNKVEQNFESSKYVEIFNVLEKVQDISEILDGNIEQVQLSSEEIELLKKLDNIVLGNKENDESFVIKKIDNMSERVKENVVYEKINENDPDIEKNNYNFNVEESKTNSKIDVNINKVEQNFEGSKYVEIFNVLEKVQDIPEILDSNIEQVKLSNEEIKLLKKLDNIILGNKKNDESFVTKKINNMKERVKENVVYEKINENDPDIEKNNNYNFDVEESKTNSKIDVNINKVEQNFESSKHVEIFNALEKVQAIPEILDGNIEQVKLSNEDIEILSVLKEKIQPKSELLGGNIEKVELSNKEVKLLKKLDNIIKGNKLSETKLVKNEKFSGLENNNNTINKLNLVRNDNLQNIDKELDTLENIVNLDDNNLMISSSQLINRNMNIINHNPKEDVSTIRKDYIGDDIIKTVKYLKSSNNEVITFKISPKELGDMTIKLTNNKDKSNVVITISKSEVFDLINDNQNEIIKHLKDLNINIKEVSIEMKNNAENNFSSNLSQEFTRNNQGNRHENRKRINLNDEEMDDVEEFYAEENINILI